MVVFWQFLPKLTQLYILINDGLGAMAKKLKSIAINLLFFELKVNSHKNRLIFH